MHKKDKNYNDNVTGSDTINLIEKYQSYTFVFEKTNNFYITMQVHITTNFACLMSDTYYIIYDFVCFEFGHISTVGRPNRFSWKHYQQLTISSQVTLY